MIFGVITVLTTDQEGINLFSTESLRLETDIFRQLRFHIALEPVVDLEVDSVYFLEVCVDAGVNDPEGGGGILSPQGLEEIAQCLVTCFVPDFFL